MVKSGIEALYFQYGDFRSYSKSGQTEDRQNRFPESVRLKILGSRKYKLYQKLCKITREMLHIEQTGENPYQGHAFFQLLCDYGGLKKYKNIYENTRIAFCIKKAELTVELRLGFEAFEKLPEIIEKLTSNAKNGFFNLRPCSPECTLKCTNKRIVVFNENIYPNKLLNPCKCETASCKIENDTDVQSIILIYEHIKNIQKHKEYDVFKKR